jgi:hypothetical protein
MHEARGLDDSVACADESLDELGLDAGPKDDGWFCRPSSGPTS